MQVNQRYSASSKRRLTPLRLQLSNSQMCVSIDLVNFYRALTVQGNYNMTDLQLTIHTPIKLTSSLEDDLIIKITKIRFQ